ncbi:MAG TPA: alcohol dehydrogenase catalytic domain-containing protein [Pyrinomonadaceae bacterium]|nr:alcohol dehydrogenase catalytic domain-containing protein [Pyrinomonadaceae bacterium]
MRYENGRLSLDEVEKPSHEGEAVVRVTLSGICNTDVEIVRGYAGFEGTIGHEFVGVVESAHGSEHLVGQRVVGEINAGCGECELCSAGDSRHCARRTVLGIVGRDGAHAEFLRLPAVNLLRVPDNVPDERAVFAEPLAAAWGITERAPIDEASRVAVIGDGKLGLLCAQALRLAAPARLVLIGKHPNKLEIASRRAIETAMLSDVQGEWRREFDVVVEASGSESGFSLALDLLRPRGALLLKSTFHGETRVATSRIVVDEISVIGSRCGRFQPALDLLARGAVDVESLISEQYSLADGVRAMERATANGIIKILLRP